MNKITPEEMIWVKEFFVRSICLVVGSFLMAFALKCIFEPAGIVVGGFSGLSVIFERLWSVPLWASTLGLNIPLFIVAFFILGKKTLVRSLFTTVMLTLFVAAIPEKVYFAEDMFLSMVTGSLVYGLGIGLILAWNVTSGGVDLLAMLINKYVKRVKIVWIMFILDGLIIIFGTLVFGIISGVYSVISVYIISFISDKIIEGPRTAKTVYIISDNYKEIADAIMTRIGRGVTGFDTIGMYSDKGRRTLMCIAGKREVIEIKKIVNEYDKKAFLIVSGVAEVQGEGFL